MNTVNEAQPWAEAEAITLEKGLKTLIIDSAWQNRMEDKIGTIEVGKYTDLVILEKDLFAMQPDGIATVKVVATIMNGKYTYKEQ